MSEFDYRLFIEKKDICDTGVVTRFIQEYVNDVKLERESSSEVVFGIKRGASQHIGRLIDALDKPHPDVGINSYGLSMTTIEEVFLRYDYSLVHCASYSNCRLVQEEEDRIDDQNHCTEETRRLLARDGKYFSAHLDILI